MSALSKRTLPALGLLAGLFLLLLGLSVRPAAAASIVVNSAADTVADDGSCTLREAITAANTDTASGVLVNECAAGSGADTITFAADTTITLAGSQLPAVTSEMTITGNGAANTIIQADAAANTATYRVFEVGTTGNLTLDGATVRHGRCTGSCTVSRPFDGGGIYNAGTLTVTNSTIADNTATNFGGGFTGGGGIRNEGGGTLTVTNSTLSGNSADFGGGIFDIQGTTTVTNSTLSGNSAGDQGGGIFNAGGTLTVTNSTLSDNSALSFFGGGIVNLDGALTVTNSTLSGNTAFFLGGGIFNNGGAATTTVTNSTLSGNEASLFGGGISNDGGMLNVFNSTLSGNFSGELGGGISNSGPLTVTNSTLSGNTAGSNGGGIWIGGGGLTVARSLVSGNKAVEGFEIYVNSGIVSANAFNVFGHGGQTDGQAYFGFTPGVSDFNATGDDQNVALAAILNTALANNGGPTETNALVAGSPAIDFGPTAACAAAPVNGLDQRGEPRSVDGNGNASANECDSGAFEYQPASATPTATPTLEPTATATATVATTPEPTATAAATLEPTATTMPMPTQTTTQTPEATAAPPSQPPVYLPVVTGE